MIKWITDNVNRDTLEGVFVVSYAFSAFTALLVVAAYTLTFGDMVFDYLREPLKEAERQHELRMIEKGAKYEGRTGLQECKE